MTETVATTIATTSTTTTSTTTTSTTTTSTTTSTTTTQIPGDMCDKDSDCQDNAYCFTDEILEETTGELSFHYILDFLKILEIEYVKKLDNYHEIIFALFLKRNKI